MKVKGREIQKVVSLLVVVTLLGWMVLDRPCSGQLLLVTGRYRIVELDRDNQRVGVALPEADPNVRQNWVYIRATTKIIKRHYRNGWFKDEFLTFDGFFASAKKGDLMKVHGGRRWDGGITAKKIWM